jgi:hypothetical protein
VESGQAVDEAVGGVKVTLKHDLVWLLLLLRRGIHADEH